MFSSRSIYHKIRVSVSTTYFFWKRSVFLVLEIDERILYVFCDLFRTVLFNILKICFIKRSESKCQILLSPISVIYILSILYRMHNKWHITYLSDIFVG